MSSQLLFTLINAVFQWNKVKLVHCKFKRQNRCALKHWNRNTEISEFDELKSPYHRFTDSVQTGTTFHKNKKVDLLTKALS